VSLLKVFLKNLRHIKPRPRVISFAICILLVTTGCNPPYPDSPLKKRGCVSCHDVSLDAAHKMACTECHGGNGTASDFTRAHRGLNRWPARPETMKDSCGRCHLEEVKNASVSSHFTLEDEIGMVWKAFFPDAPIPSLFDLPAEDFPSSPEGIVGDLLRRFCLRCHVYYPGDDYASTKRGTGCAACHFKPAWKDGTLQHRFTGKVQDKACLSCHYGNFVGWDFVGRTEKDLPEDFFAPLVKGRHIQRPYGVIWHEMTPDIHCTKGFSCTDCHSRGPCQGTNQTKPGTGFNRGCLKCHQEGKGTATFMDTKKPGHRAYDTELVACGTCHAVWTPLDKGRTLVRQDSPDFDEWAWLYIQGNSEVEETVEEMITLPYFSRIALMTDKLTSQLRLGLWFQLFYERRFGPVILGEDENGRLQVMRPLLDLSISYVNFYGETVFDNLRPRNEGNPAGLTPYNPHTIGPADIFRTIAVTRWLEKHTKGESQNLGQQ